MLDREFYERMVWQTYRDRLREGEKNRHAWQARDGVGSAAGRAAAGLRRRLFRAGGRKEPHGSTDRQYCRG